MAALPWHLDSSPRWPRAEAKVDTKDVVHDGFDPDDREYSARFDGKDPYDFSYDPDDGYGPGVGIDEWHWGDPSGFYKSAYPWTGSEFSYKFTIPVAYNEWLTVVDDDEQSASDGPDYTSPGCKIDLIEPILKINNDAGTGLLDDDLEYTTGAFVWVGELRYMVFRADPPVDPDEGTGVIKLEVLSGSNKIKLWTDSTKTTEYNTNGTYPTDETVTLYVEGFEASAAVRDAELRLYYIYDGVKRAHDKIRITVMKVNSVE